MAKTRYVTAALSEALAVRGVPAHQASLAAQLGMTTLGHAVKTWFEDDSSDLGELLQRAFRDVRELSSSRSELIDPSSKR